MSCDPQSLANQSSCFSCVTGSAVDQVKLYLLQQIAGLANMTPQDLVTAASCYSCVPGGMMKAVETYLLCQIAQGGGPCPPCPQDMEIAWTSTTTKLGEIYMFMYLGDAPGIDTITFSAPTSIGGVTILYSTAVGPTDMEFPNMVTIDPTNSVGGGFYFEGSGLAPLETVNFPVLTATGGPVFVDHCPSLTVFNCPMLATVGQYLNVTSTAVSSLDLSLLASVGNNVEVNLNPNLTYIDLSSLATVGGQLALDDNNLASFSAPLLTYTGSDLSLQNNPNIGAISLPVLTSIGGSLDLSGNINATSVSAPLLNYVWGNIKFADSGGPAVGYASMDFTSLNNISGSLYLHETPNLLAVSFPALYTISGGDGIQADLAGATAVSFPVLYSVPQILWEHGNATTFDVTALQSAPGNGLAIVSVYGCHLDQASVDGLLLACVTGGQPGGTFDSTSGTNSAPSALGATYVTALQGNGWTVTTN